MRVLLHDYSGHPFQAQLSRELARRGHEVLHVHCSSYTTGKGNLEVGDDDPSGLSFEGLALGSTFERYRPVRRVFQELRYGWMFRRRAARFEADVVISSNDPLLAKFIAHLPVGRRRPWVFWLQDIYSVAIDRTVRKRVPVIGAIVGWVAILMEKLLLRTTDHIVAITEDFRSTLRTWGISDESVTVIENWAPLDELPMAPRASAWREEHGLGDDLVLMYTGTLGLKHDPAMLVDLARAVADRPVWVVVTSEGQGAHYLREYGAGVDLPRLLVLPYQDFARYPEVLGSADVLLALLEPDAGVFSVPSKVLSYHCAGRPLLASMPGANLASRIIRENATGLVVEPGDSEGFSAAALELIDDDDLRESSGRNARDYAERTFDITAIGDRFEALLEPVAHR